MGSKTLVIAATLAVSGSALLVGAVGTAVADVPVGPGPTNYTMQPQPAPGACHYRTAANGETLPDPNCTPGAISPKVTQDTLDTTVCKTGYTKSIRPPASITEIEKRENAAAYGYTGSLKDVEYDHLLSGAPASRELNCAGQDVGGMPLTVVSL
jgi:hypothetical protein